MFYKIAVSGSRCRRQGAEHPDGDDRHQAVRLFRRAEQQRHRRKHDVRTLRQREWKCLHFVKELIFH
jgi:hypothetical protein